MSAAIDHLAVPRMSGGSVNGARRVTDYRWHIPARPAAGHRHPRLRRRDRGQVQPINLVFHHRDQPTHRHIRPIDRSTPRYRQLLPLPYPPGGKRRHQHRQPTRQPRQLDRIDPAHTGKSRQVPQRPDARRGLGSTRPIPHTAHAHSQQAPPTSHACTSGPVWAGNLTSHLQPHRQFRRGRVLHRHRATDHRHDARTGVRAPGSSGLAPAMPGPCPPRTATARPGVESSQGVCGISRVAPRSKISPAFQRRTQGGRIRRVHDAGRPPEPRPLRDRFSLRSACRL